MSQTNYRKRTALFFCLMNIFRCLPMAVVFSVEKTITMMFMPPVQGSVEGAATAAGSKSWNLTSRTSSDVLRFSEMRDRVKSLEKDVVFLKGQLSVARSKEKTATDAEAFILECLDTTSLDLAGKISPPPFFFVLCLHLDRRSCVHSCCCSFRVKSSRREKTPR